MAGKRGKILAWFGGANIFILGLVSLLNDFSSEMIAPILPLLIASFGGTGIIIGLIGGMIEGLPNLLKVVSGYFSDIAGKRKQFIFSGYFTSELFKLLLFFAGTWKGILLFMGMNKLGKGIRDAPRDALISESVPKNKRGRAFGIQRAFDTTGAILGSVSVLLLVFFFSLGFKKIILIAAIIGFMSLIPLYFLKERRAAKKQSRDFSFFPTLRNLDGKLKVFIIAAGIFALANFSYMFFVFRSAEIFGSLSGNQSNFAIPILLYVLFNIFYAVFAIPFGNLSDAIGRRKIIIAGYILFTAVCAGFIIFSSLQAFIPLFILYGMVYALVVGNQRAIVSDLSGEKIRATALGTFQTVIGAAAICSGLIAGFLFDISPNLTFAYGGALSAIAALILIFSYRRYPSRIRG